METTPSRILHPPRFRLEKLDRKSAAWKTGVPPGHRLHNRLNSLFANEWPVRVLHSGYHTYGLLSTLLDSNEPAYLFCHDATLQHRFTFLVDNQGVLPDSVQVELVEPWCAE
jgi:hypothetical protein